MPLAIANADLITVDGSLADWISPDYSNHDGADLGPGHEAYDIDWNYQEWDATTGRAYFAFDVVGSTLQADNTGNHVDIFIDIDSNKSTGSTAGSGDYGILGMEYWLYYDLSGAGGNQGSAGYGTNFAMYALSGGTWTLVNSPAYFAVARGTKAVEFGIAGLDIGSPDNFLWGAYFDNGVLAGEDWCPDTFDQPGRAPEPATLALFALGVTGLYLKRRRSSTTEEDA